MPTDKHPRQGVFTSVKHPEALHDLIDRRNKDPRPLARTKSCQEILANVARAPPATNPYQANTTPARGATTSRARDHLRPNSFSMSERLSLIQVGRP